MVIEVWVDRIGSGTRLDPFRPDVPRGMFWSSDEGCPTDFSRPDRAPAINGFNILIVEEDLPALRAYAESRGQTVQLHESVQPEDRLIVEAIRAARNGRDTLDSFLVQSDATIKRFGATDKDRFTAHVARCRMLASLAEVRVKQ